MAATKTFTIEESSLNSYTNKTILITGGASGIGLATAKLLHSLNNNVVIVDRAAPVPSPSTTALLSSPRFLHLTCNLTSWPSQRAAFQSAINRFGSIDAVFVNAGIAEHEDQFFKSELDEEGLLKEPDRRVIDIDLQAADDTIRLGIYWMRREGSAGRGRGGSLVLTASLAGYLGSAGAPLYSAAKHGIVGVMRALKSDVATLGISISVVAPGITVTPILAQESRQLSAGDDGGIQEWVKKVSSVGVPINSAEAIALAVVYLMAGGKDRNGAGICIQANKYADFEAGLAKGRSQWMGEEMLGLFRGGRGAPLFPNKL